MDLTTAVAGGCAAALAGTAAAGLYAPLNDRQGLRGTAATRSVSIVVSAALGALSVAIAGVHIAALAYVALAVATPLLVRADLQQHRLPELITLPTAALTLTAFIVDAIATGHDAHLVRAVTAAAALWAAYTAIRHLSGRSLGRGDVTLAGVLGLHLGWLSWEATIAGALAGFTLPALVLAPALLAGRRDRRARLAFGPHTLTGAHLVLAAAGLTHLQLADNAAAPSGTTTVHGLYGAEAIALVAGALLTTGLLTRAGSRSPIPNLTQRAAVTVVRSEKAGAA